MQVKANDSHTYAQSNPSLLPLPERILHDYISWHSVEALQRDTPAQRAARKYIVTSFDCPHQAGKVLTTYLNNLVLAVATNRTMLLKYNGTPQDEKNCYRILQRAAWIPSFIKDFGDEKHMKNIRLVKMLKDGCEKVFGNEMGSHYAEKCRNSTHNLYTNPELMDRVGYGIGSNIIPWLDNLGGCPFTEHRHGYNWRFDLSDSVCTGFVHVLFPNEVLPRQRLNDLFSQGIDFVYGMGLHHSFTFTQELMDSIRVEPKDERFDPEAYSFGIHSRHPSVKDDGSILKPTEITCLDVMLKRYQKAKTRDSQQKKKCQVLVMSDRPLFRTAVEERVQASGCTTLSVNHSQSSSHLHRRLGKAQLEHGPFEGAGFYRDFAFLVGAKNGFAGTDRSSSMLPLVTFTYERFMQSWKHPTKLGKDDFQFCVHS